MMQPQVLDEPLHLCPSEESGGGQLELLWVRLRKRKPKNKTKQKKERKQKQWYAGGFEFLDEGAGFFSRVSPEAEPS